MKTAWLVSSMTAMCVASLSHAAVLFEDGFEGYASGARELGETWNVIGVNPDSIDGQVTNDPDGAIEGEQYWRWSHPHNLGDRPSSWLDTSADWRVEDGPGTCTATTRLYFGNDTLQGSTQVRPAFYLWFKDANDRNGITLTIRAGERYNNNRSVQFVQNGQATSYGAAWFPDQWMDLAVTMDEASRTWGFELLNEDGSAVASESNLAYSSTDFDRFEWMRLYVQSGHSNDGLEIRVDDVAIHGPVPEPATLGLMAMAGLTLLARRGRRA